MRLDNNINNRKWQDVLNNITAEISKEIELRDQPDWRMENCPDMNDIENYADKHGV